MAIKAQKKLKKKRNAAKRVSGIGGHKFVNRWSINNEANFFINSLIR